MNDTVPLTPVLYAEDDENDAFLMRHAFSRADIRHPLLIAPDGQAVIDFLETHNRGDDASASSSPCLLLLDLNLPLRSGFDVLDWVRSHPRLADLLVVILSSSNHPKDIDRAYSLGASAYFVKPSDVTRRLELVRTLNEKWLRIAAVAPR